MSRSTYDAEDATVLIVDMQARLLPVIHDGAAVVAAAATLAAGASLLGVPVVATEHHRAALGGTLEDVGRHVRAVFRKMHFSAVEEPGFESWLPNARGTIFVAGCETHICVLQTALGMRRAGRRVAVVADACGSRRPADRDCALQHARAHGVDVVTTEMVLFELMGTCEHPVFRDVLRLVK
jgi:nicotinamidase-related amidase